MADPGKPIAFLTFPTCLLLLTAHIASGYVMGSWILMASVNHAQSSGFILSLELEPLKYNQVPPDLLGGSVLPSIVLNISTGTKEASARRALPSPSLFVGK